MSRNFPGHTHPWGHSFQRDQKDGSREQTLVLPRPSRSKPSLGPPIPPPGGGREEISQPGPRSYSFDCEDQLIPMPMAAALPTDRTGVLLRGPTPHIFPTHHLVYDALLSGARPDGNVSSEFFFFFFFNSYWLCWVLVVAHTIFIAACGILLVVACGIFSCSMQTLSCSLWYLVPQPGIEPGPPELKCGVLTTGSPGKSL